MGSQHDQIGVSSQTGLQFCRLPVQPGDRRSAAHTGTVGSSPGKVEIYKGPEQLYGQTIHVSNRPSHSNRKTSVFRPSSHETHSVAPEEALARPRSFRKGDPDSSVTPSTFRLVARRVQCVERSAITPSSACSSTVYRHLKRRLGRTLRGLHCKRHLVVHRKSPSYKFSGTESSPSGPPKVRTSMPGPDCSCCNRQHNSGLLHKQARGYEVRLSLCPPMETSVLVPSQRDNFEGKAHSRSLECDSGQTFQAQSSDTNRVVSLSTGIQLLVFQMGPPASGLVCDPVQSQTFPVCVTGAGSGSLGSGRLESTLGTFGGVSLSSSLPDSPSNLKVKGSGLSQDDPHCPGLAKHALVLGSGESIGSDSLQAASSERPGDLALQQASSQEPQQPQSPCLAPRISSIRKHGFSDEVAARIEAPQRESTRAVYKSKWTIFTKWCESHEVDFRSPSVNQIADFLLYLFKERNLQPSTIEGYRTAIADMVARKSHPLS